MTGRRLSVLGLAALVLASGCFIQKKRNRLPLDPEAIARIKPGATTIAQVAELLGSPNEIIWSNGVVTPVELGEGAGVINTFLAEGGDAWARAYHFRYTLQKGSGFTVLLFSASSTDVKYDDAYVISSEMHSKS